MNFLLSRLNVGIFFSRPFPLCFMFYIRQELNICKTVMKSNLIIILLKGTFPTTRFIVIQPWLFTIQQGMKKLGQNLILGL